MPCKQRDCFLLFQWEASVVKVTGRKRIRSCHHRVFVKDGGIHSILLSLPHLVSPVSMTDLACWPKNGYNYANSMICYCRIPCWTEIQLNISWTKFSLRNSQSSEWKCQYQEDETNNIFKENIWILFYSICCVPTLTLIFSLMRC